VGVRASFLDLDTQASEPKKIGALATLSAREIALAQFPDSHCIQCTFTVYAVNIRFATCSRWIKEALHIGKKGRRSMKRNEGSYTLSHTQRPILCHVTSLPWQEPEEELNNFF